MKAAHVVGIRVAVGASYLGPVKLGVSTDMHACLCVCVCVCVRLRNYGCAFVKACIIYDLMDAVWNVSHSAELDTTGMKT